MPKTGPYTNAELAEIARLYHLGLDDAQIAAELDRTVRGIGNQRREVLRLFRPRGLPKGQAPGPPWTPEEDGILVEGRVEGLTFRAIAERLPQRSEAGAKDRDQVLREAARIEAGWRY